MTTTTTRTQTIRKLLARKGGVSIIQLQAATEWQPHSLRAALSRFRKAGATITRETTAKGITVYRLLPSGDQP